MIGVIEEREFRENALFSQRFLAFIIDFFFCFLIIWAVTMPFGTNDKVYELREERTGVINEFLNGEIGLTPMVRNAFELQYYISQERIVISVITLMVYVGYFIIYGFIKNGQTLGKRLLRIRIVHIEEEKKIRIINIFIRSLIINWIFINMIAIVFVLIGNKEFFSRGMFVAELSQIIVFFVCFMGITINERRGLHDKLASTIVIKDKLKYEVK